MNRRKMMMVMAASPLLSAGVTRAQIGASAETSRESERDGRVQARGGVRRHIRGKGKIQVPESRGVGARALSGARLGFAESDDSPSRPR